MTKLIAHFFPSLIISRPATLLLMACLLGCLPISAQDLFVGPTIHLQGSDQVSRTRVPAIHPPAINNRAGSFPTEFIVEYNGFPTAERIAFQYAVDIWAMEIFSTFPITIEARYETLTGGALASTSPIMVSGVGGGPVVGASYSIAYANALANCDQDPGGADMIIRINDAINWNSNPAGSPGPTEYDLATVVLKQIAHGLGVVSIFAYDNGILPDECPFGLTGSGCFSGASPAYDTYIEDLINAPLTGYVNNSGAMGGAITGANLYWDGPNATIANAGVRPKLHAPATYVAGESLNNLDEISFPAADPNSLLTPVLGLAEVIHDPGDILRAMMKDLGWTLTDMVQAYFGVENITQTGNVLIFNDRSSLAVSWEWDFNDDAVPDAFVQNPAHSYGAPGTYTARLTINGNPALTHTEVVEVFDEPAFPFTYDFETNGSGFFNPVEGCDRWELGNATTGIFSGGGGAVGGVGQSWTTNLNSSHAQNTDYFLQSPPIDFVGASGDYFLRFNYRWAAAPSSGMNVTYSLDGGNNWLVLGGVQGVDPEADVGWYNNASLAILGGEAGWQSNSLGATDLTASYRINLVKGFPDVRFRIHFVTDGAFAFDGIQIDNFEIDGSVLEVEVEEEEETLVAPSAGALLSPNPFSENLTLRRESGTAASGELRLFNLAGQQVLRQSWSWDGKLEIDLSVSALPSGLYLYEWVQAGIMERGKLLKR